MACNYLAMLLVQTLGICAIAGSTLSVNCYHQLSSQMTVEETLSLSQSVEDQDEVWVIGCGRKENGENELFTFRLTAEEVKEFDGIGD